MCLPRKIMTIVRQVNQNLIWVKTVSAWKDFEREQWIKKRIVAIYNVFNDLFQQFCEW